MNLRLISRTTLVASLLLLAAAAHAGDVKVTCEKRSNRSRASVDGSNLDGGSYRAILRSGTAKVSSAYDTADGDEVEFDFDSNPADVAEGATRISPSFIVNGRVRGWIVNSSGQRVTPVAEAMCRVRNR